MPFKPPYKVPPERRAYTIPSKPKLGWEGIGCLMLHGFMGSPASTRPLAEHLSEKGIMAHCPLLPGHGNLPHRIHKFANYKGWIAEVEEALAFLRKHCDQIYIVGHSMGAVLAAHLANKYSDIGGLILLAPLYRMPDWRVNLSMIGRYVMPWFYPLKNKQVDRDIFVGRVIDFDSTIDVNDPALQDWLIEATRLSNVAVDEMRKMAVVGRKLWPQIHQPVIIFQGGNDPAVSPRSTEKLFQKLGTADKEMKFFPQVGHELMRPVERIHAKVWQKIYEFIEEHAEIGVKEPTPLNAPSLLVQSDD